MKDTADVATADTEEAKLAELSDSAKQVHDAWRALKDNEEGWPVLVLDLAHKLAALKDQALNVANLKGGNPDHLFSVALTNHDLDVIDKDTRAALLKFAEHETKALPVLEKTERRSLRLVWAEELQPIAEPEKAAKAKAKAKAANAPASPVVVVAADDDDFDFDEAVQGLEEVSGFMAGLDMDEFTRAFERLEPLLQARIERLRAAGKLDEMTEVEEGTQQAHIKEAVLVISQRAAHVKAVATNIEERIVYLGNGI